MHVCMYVHTYVHPKHKNISTHNTRTPTNRRNPAISLNRTRIESMHVLDESHCALPDDFCLGRSTHAAKEWQRTPFLGRMDQVIASSRHVFVSFAHVTGTWPIGLFDHMIACLDYVTAWCSHEIPCLPHFTPTYVLNVWVLTARLFQHASGVSTHRSCLLPAAAPRGAFRHA